MSNFAAQSVNINNKITIRQWKEHFSLTTEEEWTSTASVREWLQRMVVACWHLAALMAARSWPYQTSTTANKPSAKSRFRRQKAATQPFGMLLLFSFYTPTEHILRTKAQHFRTLCIVFRFLLLLLQVNKRNRIHFDIIIAFRPSAMCFRQTRMLAKPQ